MSKRFKHFVNRLVVFVIVISFFSCTKKLDIPQVIDEVTITAIKANDNLPLTNAEVHMTGHPDTYVTGTTNSQGIVVFNQVEANYHKLAVYVYGEDNDRVYIWDSYDKGYEGGIDFSVNPNFTIKIDPIY